MGFLHESLQQLCFSIERLEPCEQSLNKLLSLTTPAHLLIADEVMDEDQTLLSQNRHLAIENITTILEEKLYLHSKHEQLHRFEKIKDFILQSLDRVHS